jgi:2-methylcitrate dehydratase
LDTIGCAIGGTIAPGRTICEDVVDELGGREEATIIGSGKRTNAINATMVNAFLVRFLDYNDVGGGNHNSDSISSLLAVAEREGSTGADLLTSLVISYELGARVIASVPGGPAGWDKLGLTTDARGGLSITPAIGKLMKLDEMQLANAIGVCASRSAPLGILDADKEENTMAKNLRFGFITCDAILACIMAKKGFTGPIRIVEGDGGVRNHLLKGEMDLQALVDFSGWRVLDTGFKLLCANRTTHGHVLATIGLVVEHDLKPEDIAAVRIRAGAREHRHTTALPKKYPRNAETADHSAYYANAFAIKERHFGPASADPKHFTDPVILELIDKITVVHDPDLPARGHNGISEITTRDGRRLQKRVDTLPGYDGPRLTDTELEDKFRAMAVDHMPEPKIRQLFDAIWTIDRADGIAGLMKLTTF